MPPHKAYVAYRAANAISRALPGPVVQPWAKATGAIAQRVMSGRREMVERHQLRVRPDLNEADLEQAVRNTFTNYTQYWLESFRLPGTPPDVLDAGIRAEGFEYLQAAIDAGTGCVLAMPHLGAWEWAAFWITAVHHLPVSAVVEAVEPPELARWFVDLRAEFGIEVMPLDANAGTGAARALAANRVLTLLCDRDVAGGGIEVEFFGERTTLPAGPATLALRSGAPLIPATCYFEGDGHYGLARPPLDTTRQGKFRQDVARVTQDLAHEFETMIRRAPEQWHLLQPNWPSDHLAAASSAAGR
ncbi:MAG: phosphatidylinositol mannoside acyltransferase [Aquihabitans sp.]